MVDEDHGAPVAFLGEFAFHLREESDFGGCHLVDRDALPRLGRDKDLVRGLGFFVAPRNLSHRTKKAASALGWRDFRQCYLSKGFSTSMVGNGRPLMP